MRPAATCPPALGWCRNQGSTGSGRTSTRPCSRSGTAGSAPGGVWRRGTWGQLSGTFLAGVYDGHDVPVIDLVNCPDWVDTAVFVGGVRLDVDTCTVVTHHRSLDLRDGLLTRSTVFEDVEGRRTRLETMRCASMADRRVCVLRVEVTPENHAAEIRVETGINGDRRNLERLPLYPEATVFPPEIRWEKWARARHLEESSRSGEGEVLYLEMRTIDTGIHLGYAAATTYEPPPAAAHGAAAQWADHRGDRARRCPGRDAADGQARRHLHLARSGRSRRRDPARPVPRRARRTPRGRVRRRRRREPRGVGAPVGRVRLRGRRQCRLHPRPAVLPVSPDDRGEPGGSDGQHRGERAGGGALPGSRVLGHRDLPAPLLHPHPARHRQGAAALPPPHPGRRTGELPRVRHRWGALRLGVRRHRPGGMPEVHRGRRQPVLDP